LAGRRLRKNRGRLVFVGFICLVMGAIPAAVVVMAAWAHFYREAAAPAA